MVLNILLPYHRNLFHFLLFVVLVGGLWFSSAKTQVLRQGGVLRGMVTVSAEDKLTEELLTQRSLIRYRGHEDSHQETVRPYRLSEKAVVYIDSVGINTTYTPPDVHPTLNQSQMMFRPLVLPVLVGTTVDFPNQDNLYHNVFSYSQAGEFDLGRYPKGNSRSVTFSKPGIVKVYCDIHTYMYATILVLQNPYFTVPEDDGSYVIRDVPPGTYQVSCWYGRKILFTTKVTVHADQTSIINFSE